MGEKLGRQTYGKPAMGRFLESTMSFGEERNFSERTAEFPGVTVNDDYVRNYPKGEVAAHTLGYTGAITQEELKQETFEGLENDSVVGKSGVELYYEEVLRGKAGKQVYKVDALGRIVPDGSRVDSLGRFVDEDGDPIAVDPSKDELSFYPLLYWPVSMQQRPPSDRAIQKRADGFDRGDFFDLFQDVVFKCLTSFAVDLQRRPAGHHRRILLCDLHLHQLELLRGAVYPLPARAKIGVHLPYGVRSVSLFGRHRIGKRGVVVR
jgi:hypothetical protein